MLAYCLTKGDSQADKPPRGRGAHNIGLVAAAVPAVVLGGLWTALMGLAGLSEQGL